MPSLQHLPADAPAETIGAILDTDGALILDDVIAPAQVSAVMGELNPYIAATPVGRDKFTGFATTRTGALVARSPLSRELVMHPAILAACDSFLLRACDRYQLHLTQVIRIRPGQPRQALHRDRLAWGGFLKGVEPQLNTIWAMTDFTEENGATQVVPGSPLWEEGRRAEPREIGYAEMKAGSVLVYSGSVIHGGGENRSDADRVGVNITYCLGWLRQEENQYLSCPPPIARTLDKKLQTLLGYAMGSYALGYFTPPLAPGAGPEVAPPQVALGEKADGWDEEILAVINERERAKTITAKG
ncbi:MAG TPA: phytanoyl-CoA dioxygenase family protein [Caulobacteraceae bacterium]|nr:phytanoyl-CoA dioxygenase family protein [Caulobacteraceae bacterium]